MSLLETHFIQPSGALLLIDDHDLFRAGIKLLISNSVQVEHILEAGRLSDVVDIDANVRLILLDINLPGVSGIDSIKVLKERWPKAHIVMLSASNDFKQKEVCMQKGAHYFLNKNCSPVVIKELVEKLICAEYDATVCLPEMEPNIPSVLSRRQLEVLDMVCLGASNKQIAKKLCISENTARNHIAGLMRVFMVKTRTELVISAQKYGYINSSSLDNNLS